MKQVILGISAIAVFSFAGCTENTNTNRTNANMNSNMANNMNKSNVNMMNSNMTNGNMANGNMSNSDAKVISNDEKFMIEAAQGGMMEVKLGELASTKGQNAEVKAFGKKMVEDHTKANNDLKELAKKNNIQLPNDMSSDQKDMYEKLTKLSGAEFDKEYVSAMVDDHEEDLEAFQGQADDAKDVDLKAFAAKYAPVIKGHYEMIKAINDKMK
jgi:putative membrane protein